MSPFSHHTNDELLALLMQGNQSVFAFVYDQNAKALMAYTKRSIAVREDCEEIIQDVFESLWLRREALHQVTSIRGYLFSMVKYKIVDYLRHSLVKKKYEEHYLLFEAVFDNLSNTMDDPSDFPALLEKSISKLPSRCQTAFRLRLQDNLPYKDIAERMKISTKTVEKHISAALHYLRRDYHSSYQTG